MNQSKLGYKRHQTTWAWFTKWSNCSGATHSKDVMRAKDRHVFGARRYTQKDLCKSTTIRDAKATTNKSTWATAQQTVEYKGTNWTLNPGSSQEATTVIVWQTEHNLPSRTIFLFARPVRYVQSRQSRFCRWLNHDKETGMPWQRPSQHVYASGGKSVPAFWPFLKTHLFYPSHAHRTSLGWEGWGC